MAALLTRVTLRRSLDSVRYVRPVPPRAARPPVARVYAQVTRDFGMLAPPVLLHSPAPGPLAACWTLLRETLVAGGSPGRAAKEVVAAAVSELNACPYCVEVHGATLYGLARVTPADPGAAALAAWAGGRGEPPFPAGHAPVLTGVALTFHYLNRMVNVFLGDSPLPPGLPAPVHRRMLRVLGLLLRPAARRTPVRGRALGLLPGAALPPDLRWAEADPAVAGAVARAPAAIESAADVALGPSAPRIRELVAGELAAWDGAPPGLSASWADEAVAALPAADRPAARLALLTAMSSSQVGPGVVAGFRRALPGDAALVEVASWASLAAARVLTGRLPRP